MGSLGADKLSVSRYTEAHKLDNKRVAKGWKIQSLGNAVDSILASATRLEREIAKETKYWEQILDVSDAGWSLCRLPNEKHTLGVRFGFTECMSQAWYFLRPMLIKAAAPAFKSRSLAALRRNPDGTIYLDQGLARVEPQALRVRILTSSVETGSSSVPSAFANDATIESEVLQARNNIFASELWQEISRESRLLGSYGVRTYDDTLICPLTPQKTVVLDMVPLGDSKLSSIRSDDKLAEGICLGLHLFLSCAHRRKHRSRTQIPPAISNHKQHTETYSLLRPLITRMNHQSAVSAAHRLFKPLCAVLASAKITPMPVYDIENTPPSAALINTLSVTEATILALTDRLESIITFKVTETTYITVRLRTTSQTVCTTNHTISLSPESPLNIICKAPRPLDQWSKVEEYVLYATSCILASSCAQPLGHAGKGATWEPTVSANILRKINADDTTGRGKQLSFLMDFKNGVAKLEVKWQHSSTLGYESDVSGGKGFQMGEGSYEWKTGHDAPKSSVWGDEEDEVTRSLQEVVEEAGRS